MTSRRANNPTREWSRHRDRVDNPIVPDGPVGRLPDRGVERSTFTKETVMRELGSGRHIDGWSFPGDVFAEAGRMPFYFPVAASVLSCWAAVRTAPTGQAIICDLNLDDTTMFTTQANRPEIAVSTFVSAFEVPDIIAVSAGSYLLPDIDQVGSTIPGGDLVILFRWEEA